jgi:hypothetical protein
VRAFDVRAGHIQNAYAVLPPDKLRHVDPASFTSSSEGER